MSAASKETQCKRWCFTINNPTDDDMFWEDAEHQEQFSFLAVQYEVGEQGTPHYQGFVILKRKNRLTWLKKNFNGRAHWGEDEGLGLGSSTVLHEGRNTSSRLLQVAVGDSQGVSEEEKQRRTRRDSHRRGG